MNFAFEGGDKSPHSVSECRWFCHIRSRTAQKSRWTHHRL